MERISQLFNALLKKAVANNEIMRAAPTAAAMSAIGKKPKRPITVDAVLAHLEWFRLACLSKESRKAETLLASAPLQEIFHAFRRDTRFVELRRKYTELFTVMEIFAEGGAGGGAANTRSQRKIAAAVAAQQRPTTAPISMAVEIDEVSAFRFVDDIIERDFPTFKTFALSLFVGSHEARWCEAATS